MLNNSAQLALPTIDKLDPGNDGWAILAPMAVEETRTHTDEEYLELLCRLHTVGRGVQAWTGDVYNAMRKNGSHGRAALIAEQAGFEKRSIFKYGYVCKSVEIEIRIQISLNYPEITFNHFQVVAPLEYDQQKYWLEEAGRGGWSVAQLRAAIKEDKEGWSPKSFNIWSPFIIEEWQQEYPGQIPGGILKNIIHYTTNKGDRIIDVFGGGGNMGLAAEQMKRFCITYDINPKYPGMVQHNAIFPFLDGDAQLVFLDPPYWEQKQGEYEPDPTDLSNMELQDFYAAMEQVIRNAHDALVSGGYCVLIIGSTQKDGAYYDHALEIYSRIREDWDLENRVAAAYPTTQYSGNDVARALADKTMLNLYTTILFLKK